MGRRLYGLLLRLLPGEFRGDFGDAMLSDAEIAQQGGAFWWREIGGLLRAIVREHLDVLRQDLKYAFRMMRRTPGFTVTAILMLALGTGVNVAMFSVVDAVVLRSPFQSDRQQLARAMATSSDGSPSLPRVAQLPDLAASTAIAGVGIVGGGPHVLTGAGDPMSLDNMSCVSASMFDVLGTRPMIGRTFGKDEDQAGAPPTIVLAYTFWQTLGGEHSIIGSTLTINHTPVTVLGVMPRGYYGALERSNTLGWMPYSRPVTDADNSGCRHPATETTFVRLRDGLTRQEAAALVPGFTFGIVESVWMDTVRTPLKVLSAAVVCVLLIACLNVGGLQMERTLARRREISLRLALGAGGSRIARQVVTENLLFAAIGAVAGLAATALSIKGLIAMLPPNVPYMDEIAVNARVLISAIVVAALAGFISGVFPLLETRGFSATGSAGSSSRSTERRSGWARRGLVVSQIALSFVVLVGAGLMVQTFLTLRPAAPGFDPDHKLWQHAKLRGGTAAANATFYAALFERLNGAPGITAVAGTGYVPLIGLSGISYIQISGERVRPFTNAITPNYFAVMKIPLVAGRSFSSADTAGSLPAVIVNEVLARKIDPAGDVVGRRIMIDLRPAGVPGPPSDRTIVGVIANTRGSGGDLRPRFEAYLPHAQHPVQPLTLIVDYPNGGATAASAAAASVRRTILEIRSDFVITPPRDLRTMVDEPVAILKFGASVLSLFAALAGLLASIGLMTTIGWWVNQRTRELGVRMALGATRAQITGLVGRQGLLLAASGVLLGCAIAAGLTQYMTSFIYGVTPLDRATFLGCGALMLGVAIIAIFFPTRRAARVDPVIALRAE